MPSPSLKSYRNTQLPMLFARKAPDEKLKINEFRALCTPFTYSYCSSNDCTCLNQPLTASRRKTMLDTVRPGQVGCSSDQTVANVLYLPTHTVPYDNEVGIDILTDNFITDNKISETD